MISMLIAGLFLSGGIVRQAPTTISLPANTAYSSPDPESPRISERGIGRWNRPADTLQWCGTAEKPGKIAITLVSDLPESESIQYSISIGSTVHRVRATGEKQPVRVSFGEYEISKAGPLIITLASKQNTGPTFGRPESLEISGDPISYLHFNLKPRRNAASVHLNYKVPREEKLVAFTNTITAVEDPLYTYYCAAGFRRGYLGMQVNSPTERRVIFSIWDSGSEKRDRSNVAQKDLVTLMEKGENVVADSFGNEGTGGHSHKVISWRVGEPISFLVTAKPESDSTVYTGYYTQGPDPKWQMIAKFRAPNDGKYLSGLYSFVENFGGSTGNLKREARFDPQFVYNAEGKQIAITDASFSHDPTGRGDRLDYFARGDKDGFLLSNGGFGTEHLAYGTLLTHVASSKPRLDPLTMISKEK